MSEMTFLLVEDSDSDAEIVQIEMARHPGTRLNWVQDGQDGVDYLLGAEAFNDRARNPLPDMILLDLKMPRFSGFDFLKWRQHEAPVELRVIPVVVMSGSNLQKDAWRAYSLGANCYMTKSPNLDVLRRGITLMIEIWGEHTVLPKPNPNALRRAAARSYPPEKNWQETDAECTATGADSQNPIKAWTSNRAVLLVEDSPDDAIFFQRAFQAAGFASPLHTVNSGEEAIHYLRGERQYSNRKRYPLPHVVVIDTNLGGTSGLGLLTWIRQQPPLKELVVIMLSADGGPAEEANATALGANAWHQKPASLGELQALIRRFGDFWLLGGRSAA
jgi:CheY-like chemotaxis protein